MRSARRSINFFFFLPLSLSGKAFRVRGGGGRDYNTRGVLYFILNSYQNTSFFLRYLEKIYISQRKEKSIVFY